MNPTYTTLSWYIQYLGYWAIHCGIRPELSKRCFKFISNKLGFLV